MTAFNIAPASVKIFYHSPRGSHVMTRPVKTWVGTPWADAGVFRNWADTEDVDADTMIKALITLFLPIYTENVMFDSYIIYTQDIIEGSPLIPVWAELLTGQSGAITDDVSYLAYQKTYSFLTSDSHNAKIVLLDVPTGGNINREFAVTGAELAIVEEFQSVDQAWAGRDDKRPVVFRALNNSVNKSLERKYGF